MPLRRLRRHGRHPQPADGNAAAPPPTPFIVGAPRSGTTLLRLMLDAHPELTIPPETYFIVPAIKRWHQASRRFSLEDPVDAFYDEATGHRRWKDVHLDADAFRIRLDRERPREVGDAVRVFYRLYAEKVGKPRWGDKTPFYVRRMKLLQDAVPEARFVHLIRDGRAVTMSIKDLWFGPNTTEEAAKYWIARIGEGRRQVPRLNHYMEVRYEDLVVDPEPQLRRISEFLELPWSDRMLNYHEHVDERIAFEVPPEEIAPDGRVVSTAERRAIMERVSRPPDPTRINRWREDMPEEDRRTFESIAGDLLEELGYERSSTGPS